MKKLIPLLLLSFFFLCSCSSGNKKIFSDNEGYFIVADMTMESGIITWSSKIKGDKWKTITAHNKKDLFITSYKGGLYMDLYNYATKEKKHNYIEDKSLLKNQSLNVGINELINWKKPAGVKLAYKVVSPNVIVNGFKCDKVNLYISRNIKYGEACVNNDYNIAVFYNSSNMAGPINLRKIEKINIDDTEFALTVNN